MPLARSHDQEEDEDEHDENTGKQQHIVEHAALFSVFDQSPPPPQLPPPQLDPPPQLGELEEQEELGDELDEPLSMIGPPPSLEPESRRFRRSASL